MTGWLVAALAFFAGGVLAWIVASARAGAAASHTEARVAAAEARETEVRGQMDRAREEARALADRLSEAERARVSAETRSVEIEKNLTEQKALLEDAKTKLSDTFRSLAAEALAGSNRDFLLLAEDKFKTLRQDAAGSIQALVTPLGETLATYQRETRELQERQGREISTVGERLRSVAETEAGLRAETAKLVNALQSHRVRGRWGEITLRRTAELAGMSAYCDFAEQERGEGEDSRLRPDMTVKLPAGRSIVIDSKAPLDGFLDAMDALSEQEREAALQRYAGQVRAHVLQLASKEYWAQFPSAPEFVVLFIPNDSFLGAAAERDRGLIESALSKGIVFATPTTLFALLFAIERGWRQDQISKNAEKISELGQELYDRMATLADHLIKVGGSLNRAVESYNAAVGTLEGRILPKARQFKELGAGGKKEIEELQSIDQVVRIIQPNDAEGSGLV